MHIYIDRKNKKGGKFHPHIKDREKNPTNENQFLGENINA